MRKPFPEKLGSDLWFFLFMIVLGCSGIVYGVVQQKGFSVFGGTVIAGIYVAQVVVRIRSMRFARFLKAHPDIAKIYYAED